MLGNRISSRSSSASRPLRATAVGVHGTPPGSSIDRTNDDRSGLSGGGGGMFVGEGDGLAEGDGDGWPDPEGPGDGDPDAGPDGEAEGLPRGEDVGEGDGPVVGPPGGGGGPPVGPVVGAGVVGGAVVGGGVVEGGVVGGGLVGGGVVGGGGASSLAIVATPVPSATVAFVTPVTFSENVSFGSTVVSPSTGTV